jgi:hypothetical protein
MKLPISWATKMQIPFSELSITGKGHHPGNGECFKGSRSRRHTRELAQRDQSQTGAPGRPRPHTLKKKVKRVENLFLTVLAEIHLQSRDFRAAQ